MLGRASGVALVAFSVGCGSRSSAPPKAVAPTAIPSVASAPASSAPAAPSVASADAPTSGRPCGELGCLAFATPEAAFAHALSAAPRVIALGEAHVQKDAPKVKSTVRRFAEELLPKLEGRASDLVIELVTTNGSCGKAVEKDVANRQKPVTEPQAATNQNQYVALGAVAKKYGIAPHALVPECEELRAVTQAGEADIERMLVLIADATVRETEKLVASADPKRAIVLYGGALHNDLEPRPGRETWSFGPRLAKVVAGRYVEIDLVIPEFVKPTPTWQAFPWYAPFTALAPSPETILYRTSSASYVLIFPRSAPAARPSPAVNHLVYPLRNRIQNYAWGSRDALAKLRGAPAPTRETGSRALDGSTPGRSLGRSCERRALAARAHRNRARTRRSEPRCSVRFKVDFRSF